MKSAALPKTLTRSQENQRPGVVVLGHTGFLGGSIRNFLDLHGFAVFAPSSKECNLLEPSKVAAYFSALPGPFRIVLCAGITRSVEDSFESMLKNSHMVHNLLAQVSPERLAGVTYLSSTDVYGYTPPLPITEQSPLSPATFYGISKLCGELLLRRPGQSGCPVTILRLPGVYGPGDGYHSIVGSFYNRIVREGRVTILGDGYVRRDYVEIGDVCEIICRLLKVPWEGVLNVATGVSFTIRELIDRIAEAARLKLLVDYAPLTRATPGDLVFDISKLKSVLPGISFKTLDEGIQGYMSAEKSRERKRRHG